VYGLANVSFFGTGEVIEFVVDVEQALSLTKWTWAVAHPQGDERETF
jgi:hypothetical protein